MSELQDRFSRIYAQDTWVGGSGPGSRPEFVGQYVDLLMHFMRTHGVRTVLDCGCGDWQFSRFIDWRGIDYTGFDIVPSVIERNRKAYEREGVKFIHANFADTELPAADMVICKDVLQHLPTPVVLNFLRQLPKFKYALLTNDETTACASDCSGPITHTRPSIYEANRSTFARRQ